ncbi:MAG: hypothetical protein WCK84_12955 [Bacteroidota bacterium]
MKTKFLVLFAASLLVVACNKENSNNADENIIVGGLYIPYTGSVRSSISTTFNISDRIYPINKTEAIYYSYKPTSNQNIFMMTFTDTLNSQGKTVELDIFTKHLDPVDFFKKGSFPVDSIMLSSGSVRENFFHANAKLTWDTAWFENFSFKGKGYFDIIDTIYCSIESGKFYPKQKINFEFR